MRKQSKSSSVVIVALSSSTLFVVLAALSSSGLVACGRSSADEKGRPQNGAISADPPALPALSIKDDSKDLTFSYITVEGGFKTAQKVSDVPYESRDAVRVWSDVSGDGVVGPYIYVADLRNKLADGTYKCDVFPRRYFDDLAEDRRKKKALGAQNPAPTADPTAAKDPSTDPKGALTVIIYGAEWCQPCHQAEAYLKSKGVPFVHKDIDDPLANEEMADKLAAAGMKTHSIPIIDVGGKLLVGFEPGELDQAIASARKKAG